MKYKYVNNDENIIHYFKNLLIDIDNNCILEFKLFYIEFK